MIADQMDDITRPFVTFRQFLGRSTFFLWLFILVDAALPRMEMALFGGSVPIATVVLKYAVILALLVSLIFADRIEVPRGLSFIWGLILVYLLVDSVRFVASGRYSLQYIVFSYNSIYIYVLLTPFFFLVRKTVPEIRAVRLIVLIGVVVIVIGLTQHYLNRPLFRLQSTDGYFEVMSWNFFGRVRAFSMFASAASFGFFLLFFVPLCALWISRYRKSRRILAMLLLIAAVLAVYATLTRAVYASVAAAVFSLSAYSRPSKRRTRTLLTVLYLAIALALAFVIPAIVAKFAHTKLLSDSSLVARYLEWTKYGTVWLHDAASFLFGTGLIQNDRFTATKGILIDNTYLAIGLQGGIFALVFFVSIVIWMGEYLYRLAMDEGSLLIYSIASAFSTWPIGFMFATVLIPYTLLFLLAIIVSPSVTRTNLSAEYGTRPLN